MNAVQMEQTTQHELKYHIISWGLALILSLIPISTGAYGPAGMWCWIISVDGRRFGMWYGPLSFTISVLLFVYPYIIWKVYKLSKEAEKGHLDEIKQRAMLYLKNDVKPLIIYPIVYLIVSVFPLVNRIHNSASSDPIFALIVLHAMSSPLQGGLNGIVYALSKEVFRLRLSQLKIIWQNHFRENPNLIERQAGEDVRPAQNDLPVFVIVQEPDNGPVHSHI